MLRIRSGTLAFALVIMFASGAIAADWPSFRGPNYDGTTPETIAVPRGQPRVLWKVPVGTGLGTFAVMGDRAYTMAGAGEERDVQGRLVSGRGKRGGAEACLALDAKTGNRIWATPISETIFEPQGDNGPRTTPAADGDRVYCTGTFLTIACINAKDGKIVWSHELVREYKGQADTRGISNWGYAASPIVDGDLVHVYGGGPGQSFLAFNKTDGKLAWATGSEMVTHASPILATIHGVRQIIYLCQSGLVSLEPATGKELWRFPFKWNISTASTPVVAGDLIYCSAGYGVGAACAKIEKDGDRFKATQAWRKEGDLMNHWMSVAPQDGYLYGLYGFASQGRAPLQCVELATGNVKWSQAGFGQGGSIIAGDHVIVQGDKGQIAIVKATPQRYEELAAFQPLAGKCWNAAVLANGKLYARSTKEAVCIDLGGK
jgi:outer membrane protein assembly factor BamB